MMPEERHQNPPGHLDIDAVSAYVDRDLHADDLAMIAIHLSHCPACDREVLEIRTTVFLLGGLPQYEPRRSFCLGHEHARASRRRGQVRDEQARAGSAALTGQTGAPVALPPDSARGAWMSGLHVAAMVVGALLLLVTAGDLTGFVADPPSPMQLAAPTAAAGLSEPPQAAMPAPRAALPEPAEVQPAADGAPSDALESEPAGFASAFQESGGQSDGTEDGDSASEEMREAADLAQPAARLAPTVVGAASVTRAIPTPGPANAAIGEAEAAAAPEPTASDEQPSRLRIVQLALGVMLAWLIVSIAGMRWVRRLR